jgi:glycosyltransferase involved in cell wall biosynthesis
MIQLSILIATMPIRANKLANLRQVLDRQLTPEVEVITDISMNYNIGTKRNKLLSLASGKYVTAIDDDDLIAPDYIEKILKACKSDCDCIGISGVITTNGSNEMQWHISKDYMGWFERKNVYYRTPNHISPVKRELALAAGFPEISFGEDYEYSMRLLRLLNTEVKIEGILYYYRYEQKKVRS